MATNLSPIEIIKRVGEQSTLFCFDPDGERITTEDVANAAKAIERTLGKETA